MDNLNLDFMGELVKKVDIKWFNIFVISQRSVVENYHVQYVSNDHHSFGYIVEPLGYGRFCVMSGEGTVTVVQHSHVYDLIKELLVYDLGGTPHVITPVMVSGLINFRLWNSKVDVRSSVWRDNSIDVRVNVNGVLYVMTCSSPVQRPFIGVSSMMTLVDDDHYRVYDSGEAIEGSDMLRALNRYCSSLYGGKLFYVYSFSILRSVAV